MSLKYYFGKETVAVKSLNPLAAAIIITVSTTLVLAYCFFVPEYAAATLIIYISSILFLSIILGSISWIYKKKKTSLDRGEITGVTEDLNTEMIIWADDFSYVFINKRLRDLLGISKSDSNKKAGVWKAFGINAPDSSALDIIINSNSYESRFKNASGSITTIAWSTSLVRKNKKNSLMHSLNWRQERDFR